MHRSLILFALYNERRGCTVQSDRLNEDSSLPELLLSSTLRKSWIRIQQNGKNLLLRLVHLWGRLGNYSALRWAGCGVVRAGRLDRSSAW